MPRCIQNRVCVVVTVRVPGTFVWVLLSYKNMTAHSYEKNTQIDCRGIVEIQSRFFMEKFCCFD